MAAVIGFKFLRQSALLRLVPRKITADLSSVKSPCYSGGDTLLCSNIDSLAQVKYGWSLDLGMIVPVHRVSFSISLVQTLTLILDLSVLCLFGEGTKQHQHSIILFGLYRCAGRAVP